MISVILTSYNHEKFIDKAIESVLNQTYQDFELIVWDDASNDNSWEIINAYKKKDSRIKAIRNDIRKRGVRNINRAIELSAGPYIAIHHSDDVWHPTKLEKQLEVLSKESIGAVFSRVNLIDENGNTTNDTTYSNIFLQSNRSRYEWLRFFFFHGNDLCHSSVMLKKENLYECGMYRENFFQLVDFDLWVRLCLKYEIYILEDKLIDYRVLSNNNNTGSPKKNAVQNRHKFEHYNILKNYLQIDSFDTLRKIFFEFNPLPEKDSKFIPFLLGFIACQAQNNPQVQLFGYEILFKILADSPFLQEITETFGFNESKFIELFGQTSIFR